MDVSLKRLAYLAPPLVGVLGYDLYGLMAGIIVSAVAYMAPPHISRLLTVHPAPVVETVEVPEIPPAAEPCTEAIIAYQRWLAECIDNCSSCIQYTAGNPIQCDLLSVIRNLLPMGDPFLDTVNKGNSLMLALISVMKQNNLLREAEAHRQRLRYVSLLFQGIMWSSVIFLVQQILAYVVAGL